MLYPYSDRRVRCSSRPKELNPAFTWLDDQALTTYSTCAGGRSLKLKSVPSDWF